MVKFLSDEWIEYGKRYIHDNLDPVKDLGNLTTSLRGVIALSFASEGSILAVLIPSSLAVI